MRILFIGDIVAEAGLRTLHAVLPTLKKRLAPDITIANGENVSRGFGMAPPHIKGIFSAGVDVITTGNHVWDKREGFEVIGRDERILRPANFAPGVPGRGWALYDRGGWRVGVLNLAGRIFMNPAENPFIIAEEAVEALKNAGAKAIFVDFHAEATSEKAAMGHHLDGRVAVVAGTHTHVPTADGRVLPGGTGFISDVGMTGVRDSVIGVEKVPSVKRFKTGMPYMTPSAEGKGTLMGALFDVDERGLCVNVARVEENEP